MSINGVDVIAFAFGAFNLLRLASYLPQIVAVARDQHGATAISLSCWSIWIGANATTALYGWVNLGDLALTTINAFNAACCAAVLLLTVYKRATARFRQTGSYPFYALRRSPRTVCTRSTLRSAAAPARRPGDGQRSAGS